MDRKKTLQELTIKDNFMFGAVMADEENCRMLLERVLGFSIGKVEISKERSFIYHPEYKGVRLDIYAKGDDTTCYNIEMQARVEPDIAKRTRYYHSQMDMEFLASGEDYSKLSNTFVIFICDYDPFGEKKYRYTFLNQCQEDSELKLQDGNVSIFLSTHGNNEQEVPKELVRFLEFVKADLKTSENDFDDELVEKLQKTIRHIKSSREMEKRYMMIEEMLKNEWKQGYEEGQAAGEKLGEKRGEVLGKIQSVIELLDEYGTIPEALRERIFQETDPSVLSKWHKLAAKAGSVEQFEKEM